MLSSTSPVAAPTHLTIVVPTFNEQENIEELLRRLDAALAEVPAWEVVFVDDDSPDGTASMVRALAQKRGNVRCVQRIGRRGLSSAVIEGILASSSPFIVAMDADLQHDEQVIPRMLKELGRQDVDMVVATRYAAGGNAEAFNKRRLRWSRYATWLANRVLRVSVSDPMSGFFAVRREVFDRVAHRLSGEGFKILLDMLASSPKPLKVSEVAYTFRQRYAGVSKLDSAVAMEYLKLLIDKKFGRWIPARFVMFCMVGTIGLVVHFSALSLLHKGLKQEFPNAQLLATLTAMLANYAIHNVTTYRDRRHHGWAWWRGLGGFVLLCGVGMMANVGVASALFVQQRDWVLAALAGVLVGTVWNYATVSFFTWRPK